MVWVVVRVRVERFKELVLRFKIKVSLRYVWWEDGEDNVFMVVF